jgi:hypothetical protein
LASIQLNLSNCSLLTNIFLISGLDFGFWFFHLYSMPFVNVLLVFQPKMFLLSFCIIVVNKLKYCERMLNVIRDRSFDRITFFWNLSVVLSKFVSKEKIRSFEYRPRLNVLSKVVLSKYSKERYSKKKMEKTISNLIFVRLG